jgi:D-alanyl-D-alanine carboxypeptidase
MSNELKDIYVQLGISERLISNYKLERSPQAELQSLEIVSIDYFGRPFVLTSDAAKSWRMMYEHAHKDNILIEPFSGFRSYRYQKQLIETKLKNGKDIDEIVTETAIPGYSEHHTGRAVDICVDGIFELTQNFENTNEFSWLSENAHKYNFYLSYPKDNTMNIIYEPWHWCFDPKHS